MYVTRTRSVPGRISVYWLTLNFQSQPGWKEIVIQARPGVTIRGAGHSDHDRSHELTAYPADRADPPFDLRASVEWTTNPAMGRTPVIQPINQPQPPGNPARTPSAPVAKSDFLSRLLNRRDLTLVVILTGLGVAFGFGAMHAGSPGHGKTIVAAYLVGSRGMLGHALLLAGTVGTISGLAIVVIGGSLLWKRARHAWAHAHGHPHHHHDQVTATITTITTASKVMSPSEA